MKYRLTQLLLEDTQFQQIGVGDMPSEELADKAALMNTYAWLSKAVGAVKSAVGEKAMAKLYEYGTPAVRAKIKAARAYAKRKDREISRIIRDDSYCNYIWSKFDPANGVSPVDRKALANCLGFYTDPILQDPKIEKDAAQSDAEFEAEVKQGCKEMMLAASISAIDDLRSQIARMSREVADLARNSRMREIIDQIAEETGEKGYQFQIDLAEDPEIKPIFDAQEEAESLFRDQLDIEAKEVIFRNPNASYNISRRSGVVNMCARPTRRPIPESVDEITSLLLEIDDPDDEPSADEDESADEDDPTDEDEPADDESTAPPPDEPSGGRPIQPPPRTLEDALAQIKSRYPAAGSIISKLEKRRDGNSSIATEIIVQIASDRNLHLSKLKVQFPGEDGRLGKTATQITTQGSISTSRMVSGIVLSFLTGARTKYVQPETVRMISDIFDPSFGVSSTGSVTSNADIRIIFNRVSSESDGITDNVDMQRAFIYAMCAVSEFASQYATGTTQRLSATDLGSFGRRSLDDVTSYYAMDTRFPDSDLKSGIKLAPGEGDSGWMRNMVSAVKSPGSFADKIAKFRKDMADDKNRLTTFKAFPNVNFDEEETLISPQVTSARQKQRDKEIALVNKTIAQIVKGTAGLAANAARARRELGVPDRSAGTGPNPGRLSVMSLCDEIASVANRSKASGVGKVLMMMGYSAPDSLMLRSGPVTGHDVWLKLCQRTGALAGPPIGSVKFSAETHFGSWSAFMTAKNGAQALNGLRWLIISEFVSLPLRVAYHAIEGYRDRMLLTTGEAGTFAKLTQAISGTYVALVTKVDGIRQSAPLSATGVQLAKSGMGRKVLARVGTASIKFGRIPPYYDALDISKPLDAPTPLDPAVAVTEGAPFVVDASAIGTKTSGGDTTAVPGGPGGATPPPATPPAGPGTTPPPPPAPPEIRVSVIVTEGSPDKKSANISDASVTISIAGGVSATFSAKVEGGAAQREAARSNPGALVVSDIVGAESDNAGVKSAISSSRGRQRIADIADRVRAAVLSDPALLAGHGDAPAVMTVEISIDEADDEVDDVPEVRAPGAPAGPSADDFDEDDAT